MAFNLQTFQKIAGGRADCVNGSGQRGRAVGFGRPRGGGSAAAADGGRDRAIGCTTNQQQQQEACSGNELATSLMPAIFAFAACSPKKA